MNGREFKLLALSLLLVGASLGASDLAAADELRIIDTSGLVRGVSVVRSTGTVSLTYTVTGRGGVTCTVKNVDGLSNDRSVVGSSTGEGQGQCSFQGLTSGTWQVTVEGAARWQVRISGTTG